MNISVPLGLAILIITAPVWIWLSPLVILWLVVRAMVRPRRRRCGRPRRR